MILTPRAAMRPTIRHAVELVSFTGRLLLAFCALLLWAVNIPVAQAQAPVQSSDERRRPRICLALSGGGARGLAHVGVLRALEALRVPVDCVAGTSMGAIVGGLYSAGYSPQELDTIVHELEWGALLRDAPERRELPYRRKIDDQTYLTRWEFGVTRHGFTMPPSLVAGHRIGAELRLLALRAGGIDDFNDLPVPFRAVATDTVTGETVVLDRGDLGLALRASAAIPGLFAPVELNNRLLVDGGLVDNVPVDVAKTMQGDVIIAVDLNQPLINRQRPNSMISVIGSSFGVLERRETERALADATVVIRPDVSSFGSLDFDAVDVLVERGVQAVNLQAEVLRRFAVDELVWQRRLDRQRRAEPGLTVGDVTVAVDASPAPADVAQAIQSQSGQRLDRQTLEADIARIWRLGEFETVDFALTPTEFDTWDLHIAARRKSWGPNFLRFGIAMVSDLEGAASFNVLSALTMTELNALDAELKLRAQIGEQSLLSGEWYQPLTSSGALFAALSAVTARSKAQVPIASELVQYRFITLGGGSDLGVALGRYGEMRLGLAYTDVSGRASDEHTEAPHTGRSDAGYHWRATYDQLDRVNFPRRGMLAIAGYYKASAALGSDERYRRAYLQVVAAATRGRHSLIGLFNGSSALGGELPPNVRIQLGGLFNLSGLPVGEVSGNYGGKGALLYIYRLGRLPNFVDGLYVGVSAEAGNAWERTEDVNLRKLRKSYSLVFGVDTYLGPVYLAHGRTSGGKDSLYFYLGRSF